MLNAETLTPQQVRHLVGGEFLRWPLPCDFCRCVPRQNEPTWLVFWSDVKARHLIACRAPECLRKALDAHTAEQSHLDSLVEAQSHPGLRALHEAAVAVLGT